MNERCRLRVGKWRIPVVLALAAIWGPLAACSSSGPSDAPSKQGPNSTGIDPGPNTTVGDPGPNPTSDAPTTLSGTFSIVDQTCAQLVLDDNRATLRLQMPASYTLSADGLRRGETLIAMPKARLFVTGRRTSDSGPCATTFAVDTVNSAQNP